MKESDWTKIKVELSSVSGVTQDDIEHLVEINTARMCVDNSVDVLVTTAYATAIGALGGLVVLISDVSYYFGVLAALAVGTFIVTAWRFFHFNTIVTNGHERAVRIEKKIVESVVRSDNGVANISAVAVTDDESTTDDRGTSA